MFIHVNLKLNDDFITQNIHLYGYFVDRNKYYVCLWDIQFSKHSKQGFCFVLFKQEP